MEKSLIVLLLPAQNKIIHIAFNIHRKLLFKVTKVFSYLYFVFICSKHLSNNPFTIVIFILLLL